MKALSIRQPWVWAILCAGKRVENRDWKPDGTNMRAARSLIGKEIAIHASQGMTRGEFADFLDTVRGFLDPRSIAPMPMRDALERGGIAGTVRLVAIINDSCSPEYGDMKLGQQARESPWFFGSYGLVLADAKPTKFLPFKGSLGFFDIPDEIVRAMAA